jgi:hypothetical protein
MPDKIVSVDDSATLQTKLEATADDIFGGVPIAPAGAVVPVVAAESTDVVEPVPANTSANDVSTADADVTDDTVKPAEVQAKPGDKVDPVATTDAAPAEDLYKTPEGISKRAGERFEKLVTALKEKDNVLASKDAEMAEQAKEVKLYNEVLSSTGLSGGEAVRMIEIGAMMKHEPEKAVKLLYGVVASMSEKLGMALPGVDPLAKHQDLKQRVADREITQKDAEELVKARNTQAVLSEEQKRRLGEQQLQDEYKKQQSNVVAQVDAAKADIGAFLKTKVSDPDWPKLAPFLADAATFASSNLAPSKWLSYIEGEHKRIKAISTAARAGQTPIPIVDTHRVNGGAKAPTTPEELADSLL